ncbi:unnamed protein product [Schistocephalus solidus]|uniref:Uncharacterized protein n=1 Tax=Schistocephalus solidus TaxID=70667 RepID=A0A3P7CFN9_SCHSO|nr:unnamed protein product [Schistocephalus solidus]
MLPCLSLATSPSPLPQSRARQQSTRAIQQKLYTDVEEDTVYLQLLLITIASLVLVVFVVSIVFSCWWIKSRQDSEEEALGTYATDTAILLFINMSTLGHLTPSVVPPIVRPSRVPHKAHGAVNYERFCWWLNGCALRLPHFSLLHPPPHPELGFDTVMIVYACHTRARPEVDLKHLCESASSSQLNQLANGHTSADGDIELLSLGQTFLGAHRPEEKLDELLCGTEYATFAGLEEHQDTKVCEVSMPGTTHTQPRYTIAGANSNGSGGTMGTIIGIPTSVCPTASAVPSVPRDGVFLVTAENALTNTTDRTGSLLPGASSTTGRTRHVAKEFLDETVLNTATRRKRSKNLVSPQTVQMASASGFASLVPVPQSVILLPASGGAGTDPNAAFLLASSTAGTVMRPMSPIHVLGTIDTGGATLIPSVMAPLPQPNQCELHPTSSGGTLFVQVNSSHQPTAEQFARLSPLPDTGTEVVPGSGLPVSVLTAPYVADELLAEMAACPQHSYLVRQQINKTFEASPPDASSPVTTYESPPTESLTTTEASEPPKEPEAAAMVTSVELVSPGWELFCLLFPTF